MLLELSRERPAVLPADRATLLVEHAAELVTLGWSFGDGARGGLWQGDPGLIHDGAVAIGGDGRVLAVGPTNRVRDAVDLSSRAKIVDAAGCAIVPGFVDPCAEAVAADLTAAPLKRITRARKADPVKAALALPEADRVAALWRRLDSFLLSGTTSLVLNSGYGLGLEDELAVLRSVQAMSDVGPVSIIGALRAGASAPKAFRSSKDGYVDVLTYELLPDVADEELASLFSLRATRSVVSLEQSWRLLRAAQAHGLQRRVELGPDAPEGILDLAVEMGVHSIVLWAEPSEPDLHHLADSSLVAILPTGAPNVAEWGARCARRLIELGVPLAIGTGHEPTDTVPGTMLGALRFACHELALTPAEALVAATLNAAYASGLGDDLGPLEPGKRADMLILDVPSYTRLSYDASEVAIRGVVKDGWLVVDQGERIA